MRVNVGDILKEDEEFFIVSRKYKKFGRVWIDLANVKDLTDRYSIPVFSLEEMEYVKVG